MGFPKLEGRFILAPMSGVTDIAFRALCRRHGAAMTYTEFASADGIVRGNLATERILEVAEDESPVGVQLFGSSQDTVKQAALQVQERATVVDFNLGCPAWHILSQGCGSALLGEPEQVESIVRDVAGVLDKPFTVKLRLGLDENRKNYLEVARRCVAAGAVAVTLHGRTTRQSYSGSADWDAIKRLKDALDVPVIGNGDVFTPEDAVRMLRETGCDYVMIGRGARNDPLIFEKANQLLATGDYEETTPERQYALIEEYLGLAERYGLEVARVKTHVMHLTKGLRGAREVRTQLSKAAAVADIRSVLEAARAV